MKSPRRPGSDSGEIPSNPQHATPCQSFTRTLGIWLEFTDEHRCFPHSYPFQETTKGSTPHEIYGLSTPAQSPCFSDTGVDATAPSPIVKSCRVDEKLNSATPKQTSAFLDAQQTGLPIKLAAGRQDRPLPLARFDLIKCVLRLRSCFLHQPIMHKTRTHNPLFHAFEANA